MSTIEFTSKCPRRQSRVTDLMVRVSPSKTNGVSCFYLSLSAGVQALLKYQKGDRVVPSFDEKNKAWTLEKVTGDRAHLGYLLTVHKTAVYVRFTAPDVTVKRVMGSATEKEFDFLEVDGTKATFMESDGTITFEKK